MLYQQHGPLAQGEARDGPGERVATQLQAGGGATLTQHGDELAETLSIPVAYDDGQWRHTPDHDGLRLRRQAVPSSDMVSQHGTDVITILADIYSSSVV